MTAMRDMNALIRAMGGSTPTFCLTCRKWTKEGVCGCTTRFASHNYTLRPDDSDEEASA